MAHILPLTTIFIVCNYAVRSPARLNRSTSALAWFYDLFLIQVRYNNQVLLYIAIQNFKPNAKLQ